MQSQCWFNTPLGMKQFNFGVLLSPLNIIHMPTINLIQIMSIPLHLFIYTCKTKGNFLQVRLKSSVVKGMEALTHF